MNIILSGYGRMGHEVESVAFNRGHVIVARLNDSKDWAELNKSQIDNSIVIDFSLPASVLDVYNYCFQHHLPIVSGTTGWLSNWDKVMEDCKQNNGTFFYASNFSLGVNIFFHLNQHLAEIMGKLTNYHPSITETHHIHKLDAPSGTAISLANQLIANNPKLEQWTLNTDFSDHELPVTSLREGEVPGTHVITYKSDEDEISIEHRTKNRRGFALGAVLAAEFVAGKTGVFSMKEMLKDLI